MKGGAIATLPPLFMSWADRINGLPVKNPKYLDLCVYDDRNKGEIVTKVRLEKYWENMAKYEPTLLGSCNGLLLFVAKYYGGRPDYPPRSYRAFVLNPVTQELVVLHLSFKIYSMGGIYRDPSTNEYKVVFTDSWCNSISFYRASLKSMRVKKILDTKDYTIREHYPCTFAMNGSLHWMVYRTNLRKGDCPHWILVFNTEREEIDFQPHPGSSKSYCCKAHPSMHLVATTEHLWLFNVLMDNIDVWVLRDYDSWTWDRRNNVSLNWSPWKFRYPRGYKLLIDVIVAAVRNNVELLICWTDRGMFWYNIENHSIRRASIFKDKASVRHFHPLLRCGPYIETFARIKSREEE
jgi:hypothetical protein